MSLAFYMDEHVPKPITLAVRIRGVDVLTTQEDDRRATEDALLLDRATQLGRVMFSFDADMLRHTTSRLKKGIKFAGLVFAHPARISVGECVRDIEMITDLFPSRSRFAVACFSIRTNHNCLMTTADRKHRMME